jgi:hypothetical protein
MVAMLFGSNGSDVVRLVGKECGDDSDVYNLLVAVIIGCLLCNEGDDDSDVVYLTER